VYERLDNIAVDQGSVVEASPSHRTVCRAHSSHDGLPTGRHGHAPALRIPLVLAGPPPGRVGAKGLEAGHETVCPRPPALARLRALAVPRTEQRWHAERCLRSIGDAAVQ
jgi:hypothetical protein